MLTCAYRCSLSDKHLNWVLMLTFWTFTEFMWPLSFLSLCKLILEITSSRVRNFYKMLIGWINMRLVVAKCSWFHVDMIALCLILLRHFLWLRKIWEDRRSLSLKSLQAKKWSGEQTFTHLRVLVFSPAFVLRQAAFCSTHTPTHRHCRMGYIKHLN